MAFKSHENQSRDLDWGIEDGNPTLDQLLYGATARIATALEDLTKILRHESQWCKIRRDIHKIAEGTVTVRHEWRINIRWSVHWPWSKKHKK